MRGGGPRRPVRRPHRARREFSSFTESCCGPTEFPRSRLLEKISHPRPPTVEAPLRANMSRKVLVSGHATANIPAFHINFPACGNYLDRYPTTSTAQAQSHWVRLVA